MANSSPVEEQATLAPGHARRSRAAANGPGTDGHDRLGAMASDERILTAQTLPYLVGGFLGYSFTAMAVLSLFQLFTLCGICRSTDKSFQDDID